MIGALLGGLVTRAGEKSYESQQQARDDELRRQQVELSSLIGNFNREYDYLDEAGRNAYYSAMERSGKMKAGTLTPMARFAEQIYKVLPPFQSGGAPSGPRQSINQLPTPGETGAGSAAIMSPHTIPTPPARDRSLMMSQVPIIRKLQIVQQQKNIGAQDELQQQVSDIMNSGMSDADKAMAIRALHIPTPILAAQEREAGGGGSPAIGLGIVELVSPDGKQRILAQSTRTGHLVETGTGRVLDPAAMAGWTKRHAFAPRLYTNQGGTIDALNTEELSRQMNATGTIAGTVPDIRPAETKAPLVDLNTGKVAGQWGSRSGLGGMTGQGVPAGPQTDSTAEAPPPAPELGRSPRPKAEIDARTYMDTALSQLEQIQEIAARRPDLIGQWDYSVAAGKRWMGIQNDPDANNFINALKRFSEDAIRAKEGAVIPDAMYARLQNIVSAKGWTNEQQFADDIKNAVEVLNIARFKRGMPLSPNVQGRTPRTGAAPAQSGASPTMGGEVTVVAPNGKTYVFPNQQEANKFKQAAGIK